MKRYHAWAAVTMWSAEGPLFWTRNKRPRLVRLKDLTRGWQVQQGKRLAYGRIGYSCNLLPGTSSVARMMSNR